MRLSEFNAHYKASPFKIVKNIKDLEKLSYFDVLSCLGQIPLHCGGIRNTAELLFIADINGKSKILEVGCGTGATTCALLNVGLNVSVLEPSINLLRSMIRNCMNNASKVPKYYNSGAEDMSAIPDNEFDAVIMECVFGFIKDKSKAIQEIFRILKPGGVVAITDFNYHSIPSEFVINELKNILGIEDIMTKNDWHNHWSAFRLEKWEEVGMATGEVSIDIIRSMLKDSQLYHKFPFGETGICIVANKLKNWGLVFAENRKNMIGFNAVWRKNG